MSHNPKAVSVITSALSAKTTGMGGGEPVTYAYRPEGLALIILKALTDSGLIIATTEKATKGKP